MHGTQKVGKYWSHIPNNEQRELCKKVPIIDFALATPVLIKEKHQPGVDVVHIPENAINYVGEAER